MKTDEKRGNDGRADGGETPQRPWTAQERLCNALAAAGLVAVLGTGGWNMLRADGQDAPAAAPLVEDAPVAEEPQTEADVPQTPAPQAAAAASDTLPAVPAEAEAADTLSFAEEEPAADTLHHHVPQHEAPQELPDSL